MRKLLSITILFLLVGTMADGQEREKDLKAIRAANSTVIKQECKRIADSYYHILHLSKKQNKRIYDRMKRYYLLYPYEQDINFLHTYLQKEMKDILTVDQYNRFLQLYTFPEQVYKNEAMKA
jgi:hypothetical protein